MPIRCEADRVLSPALADLLGSSCLGFRKPPAYIRSALPPDRVFRRHKGKEKVYRLLLWNGASFQIHLDSKPEKQGRSSRRS